MSDDRDIAFAGFGLLAGVGLFFGAFQLFRKKQLIDNIPTSTVRGMAIGLVELCGRPKREPFLKGPISGEDCVLYDYRVERYEQSGKSSRWVTIASGNSFELSFYLEDDTGCVMVLPQGAEFISGDTYTYTTGWGSPLTGNLMSFMDRNAISYKGFLGNYTLRFTERTIKPSQSVYVLGTAKKIQNTSGLEDVVVAKGETESTFIISNESQKDLDETLGWQIVMGVFGGAALTVGCLWYLLMRFKMF